MDSAGTPSVQTLSRGLTRVVASLNKAVCCDLALGVRGTHLRVFAAISSMRRRHGDDEGQDGMYGRRASTSNCMTMARMSPRQGRTLFPLSVTSITAATAESWLRHVAGATHSPAANPQI